ncbi:MMPL family transporter [Frigidibacter albus]|uniref:MMPL family transporter n=1 Tax=Frigidibacter albus TaxID=1465486 RepID=A0A6L8VE98_9RHOB|nr:efflux RND transporter permease subunit [Frigidibacter albus]MZQ87560.1 MMPL family transporter [Frigidibacter albus]NBE29466.1 MMPL family transporter [Frigidibacter albus]GGH44704.1 multidrug resistance protein [Frigidibacter albus]
MHAAIAAAFLRVRSTMLVLLLILGAGAATYVAIPKEASPEIDIPIFIVNVTYSGISAEDSARLLVEPLERQLQSIEGLRQMTGQAGEGFASVTLEFDPGFDQQTALQSVRDEADNAAPDLPDGADAPIVREIDLSLFPILTVALSGEVPERELIRIGRDLQDALEAVPGVLQAELTGEREDILEILIDPLAMQTYGISTQQIAQAVQNNNQLVAAGAFDTGAGRIGVSIPGTIRSISDVLAMPVRESGGTVVRVQDVAEVRQTFQDPVSFARIDGTPTIGLDISKTAGANIIDTVNAVQAVVDDAQQQWSGGIRVDYLQNQAEDIQDLLSDLENNVIAAVVLVMLTTILALGLRAALLVTVAIPGAFLGGILVIGLLGFTMNIVVLFGLILVIGMLVDGAIVVVELAERNIDEGKPPAQAFLHASQRMAWPITASTATTLAVFFPLLFWPGVAGQFMFYLPATVIVTLTASLLMALVFVPVIGTLFPARKSAEGTDPAPAARSQASAYARALRSVIGRPGLVVGICLLGLLLSFFTYGQFGRGLEFFPAQEAERAQIQVQADGNLSVREADRLVRMVENRVIGIEGVERVYSRTIGSVEQRTQSSLAPDVIGTLQTEFADWRLRDPASAIIARMRDATADLPGIGVQIEEAQQGPGEARPIQIEIAAEDRALMPQAAQKLQALMAQQGRFVDISSDVPLATAEIRIEVDREQAARYGVQISDLGTAVQLLTNGVVLGTYLPPSANDEVDITLRYPAEDRTFAQLADLRIATASGSIPVANFVTLVPSPAASVVNRIDGETVQTVSAAVAEGSTAAAEIAALQQAIDATDFGEGIEIRFAGEIEDQQETMVFLIGAFIVAVFLMFIILLIQLNSFFQSALVLSAIIFSMAGVLLGLVARQEAFSLVMSGIGIVSLAGIVVNNNIVLIDAYNEHRAAGMGPADAAFQAGTDRFRPVLLTAVTTIIGLMPMVLGMTVDFTGRDLYFGAPSGQFWVQLATAIVGGLTLSTLVTVFMTPALLAWDGNRRQRRAAPRGAIATSLSDA